MTRISPPLRILAFVALLVLLPAYAGAVPNLEPPRRGEFPILGSGKVLVMTITGKLVKVPNERGESTGWIVELDRNVRFDGRLLARIEVDPLTHEISEFTEKRVEIKGRPAWMEGDAERGFFPILELSAIHEIAS
jgi:hypothetical protein